MGVADESRCTSNNVHNTRHIPVHERAVKIKNPSSHHSLGRIDANQTEHARRNNRDPNIPTDKKVVEGRAKVPSILFSNLRGPTILITIVTNGQYINHIYFYHLGHEYQLSKLFMYNRFFRMHLIVITTATLFTIYYLKAGKTTPSLYYPLALLFSLSILKIRATTNYYVEPVASTILFIAASSREISKKRDLLMIAFTLLMISQFIIYSQNIALVPQYRRKSSIFKQTRATRLPTKRRWLSIM